MTAHEWTRTRRRLMTPGTRDGERRRGFTLTELLVVIAIIVLLITVLLVALGTVQAKARETQTVTTMQAFINGCDAFRQEHGYYPGIVPEDILVNDPQITSTENMLLHLMGGFVRREDGETEYNATTGAGWQEIRFADPAGGTYDVKINVRRMGDGPYINGRQYAPYFTPGSREFAAVEGQINEPFSPGIPDLVDAWGQPILCLRRQREVGPLLPTTANQPAQFDRRPLEPYLLSTELGKLGRDQSTESILVVAPDPNGTLARFLEHPSLEGQARGAIACFSAGKDGVYFSQIDGAGEPGTPVTDILQDPWLDDRDLIEEYDDIVRFGGS